ncbi:MAG: DUF202 domain-containing protein [Acidobacteria bacterium]|nr:DUF202 domain-containing protein [Acidobacteriota bacterium]
MQENADILESGDKQAQNELLITSKDEAMEYLSNERTFLAWIRTSIAVISLGFVVAKFGIWIGDISRTISPKAAHLQTGVSVPVGIAMVIFGGILSVLAAWRYQKVNLQIKEGKVKADRGLIIAITSLVVILSIVMVVYMISAAVRF